MRLKWSLRRHYRWRRRDLMNVYVSINSGDVYWIQGKYDIKRNKGKSHWFWKNWTVYQEGLKIGTWPTMTEAKYMIQKHLDNYISMNQNGA